MPIPTHDDPFTAAIATYEQAGWTVQTIDPLLHRAIVRCARADQAAQPGAPVRDVIVCRKLWVDRAGVLQETDVPC